MRPPWAIFFLFSLVMTGCNSGPDLVIWADPWLDSVALGMASEYQTENPDHEVELVFRSSEVIAQNLKFEQPIDVILSLNPLELNASTPNIEGAEMVFFASDRVVLVESNLKGKTQNFGTDGCLVVPASDRPLRNHLENWPGHPLDSCKLVADFPAQVRDYLARGWAKGGYIFKSGALQLGSKVTILEEGPAIEGCLSGIQPELAPNPENAEKFLNICRSEKTKSLLVKNHFIPYF